MLVLKAAILFVTALSTSYSVAGSVLSPREVAVRSVIRRAEHKLQKGLAFDPPLDRQARFYALFCIDHMEVVKGHIFEEGAGLISLYRDRPGHQVSSDKPAGFYFVKTAEFPGVPPHLAGRPGTRFINLNARDGAFLGYFSWRGLPAEKPRKFNRC